MCISFFSLPWQFAGRKNTLLDESQYMEADTVEAGIGQENDDCVKDRVELGEKILENRGSACRSS